MRPSEETRATRVDDGPTSLADAPAVLDERYELGPVLGQGGTATVYRARDRRLDRTVAVKLFASGALGPDQRRHEHEVRALSHLDHPGLVKLYDAGSHEGRAYLVMQLVEGQTLADRIGDGDDPLSPETTAALGAVLADTLGYVHDRGVVHRDLKPANVLLDTEGHPLITDFGIARLVDTTRVTATGFMVGTAAYLAPEQVRGEHVGAATDVYALGLVLLEAITGRREYPGGALEAAVARLHRPPAVPDSLPEPMAGLLRRMTADDPAQRPSAASVAETLREVGTPTVVMGVTGGTATQAIAPLAASPGTGPATAPTEHTQPEPTAAPARRRRRLALFTGAGVVAAVIAAVLAVLALDGPREAPVPPPAQPAPISPVEPQPTEQQNEAPADPDTTVEQPPPTETGQPEQPPQSGQQQPPLPLPDLGPPPTSEQAPTSTTEPPPSETEETTPESPEPQPTDDLP